MTKSAILKNKLLHSIPIFQKQFALVLQWISVFQGQSNASVYVFLDHHFFI